MSPSASKSAGAGVSRNRVERRPQAISDLADIAVYLAEDSGSDEVAFRFLAAAAASFESLGAMPEMGTTKTYKNPALVDVRMWRVAGLACRIERRDSVVHLGAAQIGTRTANAECTPGPY